MINKLAPCFHRNRREFSRSGYFGFGGLEYIGNTVGHTQARQHGQVLTVIQSEIIMSSVNITLGVYLAPQPFYPTFSSVFPSPFCCSEPHSLDRISTLLESLPSTEPRAPSYDLNS